MCLQEMIDPIIMVRQHFRLESGKVSNEIIQRALFIRAKWNPRRQCRPGVVAGGGVVDVHQGAVALGRKKKSQQRRVQREPQARRKPPVKACGDKEVLYHSMSDREATRES